MSLQNKLHSLFTPGPLAKTVATSFPSCGCLFLCGQSLQPLSIDYSASTEADHEHTVKGQNVNTQVKTPTEGDRLEGKEREKDRQGERQRDTETGTETDNHRDAQKERQTKTERQRQRQNGISMKMHSISLISREIQISHPSHHQNHGK